jgi:hypothetical protein
MRVFDRLASRCSALTVVVRISTRPHFRREPDRQHRRPADQAGTLSADRVP